MSSGYREAPVGAFIIPRGKHLNTLRLALRDNSWLKTGGQNITSFNANKNEADEKVAIHGSMLAAAVMESLDRSNESKDRIPAPVAAAIEASGAQWVAGLRIGSPLCAPPTKSTPVAAQFPCPSRWSEPSSPCPLEGPSKKKTKVEHLPPTNKHAVFTFSELFAGIGGFRVALEKLGGRCVFVSEQDAQARAVYCHNFNEKDKNAPPDSNGGSSGDLGAHRPCLVSGDITEVDTASIGPHDILTGGFPCQTFSCAGQGQGFSDPRGLLFREIVRVLHGCRPKAFLLENVANLVVHDQGRTLAVILAELEGAGYQVEWRLINARTVLPQQRSRVFLVGLRRPSSQPPPSSFTSSERGEEEEMATPAAATSTAAAAALGRPFVWPELPVLETTLADILVEGVEPEQEEQVGFQTATAAAAGSFSKVVSSGGYAGGKRSSDDGGGGKKGNTKGNTRKHGRQNKRGRETAAADDGVHAGLTAVETGGGGCGGGGGGGDCGGGLVVDVDSDPRFVLTPAQFEKIKTGDDWAKGRRLARLDGGARTLMSSYRKGFSLRSEFVFRNDFSEDGAGGGEDDDDDSDASGSVSGGTAVWKRRRRQRRPRFYTPSECKALMGFPRSFSFAANPPKSWERCYHQMGNAVCPPVACAVGARLLDALGLWRDVDQGQDDKEGSGAVANGGGSEEEAASARRRRSFVRPALELLLDAYPRPGRPLGKKRRGSHHGKMKKKSQTSSKSSDHDDKDGNDGYDGGGDDDDDDGDARSLSALVEAFLQGGGGGCGGGGPQVAACAGRGPHLNSQQDLEVVKRLLLCDRHSQPGAVMAGLSTVGRAAFYELSLSQQQQQQLHSSTPASSSLASSSSAAAMLRSGVVALVLNCLAPPPLAWAESCTQTQGGQPQGSARKPKNEVAAQLRTLLALADSPSFHFALEDDDDDEGTAVFGPADGDGERSSLSDGGGGSSGDGGSGGGGDSRVSSAGRCLTVASEVPRLAIVALSILSHLFVSQAHHQGEEEEEGLRSALKLRQELAALIPEGSPAAAALRFAARWDHAAEVKFGSDSGDKRTAQQAREILCHVGLQ